MVEQRKKKREVGRGRKKKKEERRKEREGGGGRGAEERANETSGERLVEREGVVSLLQLFLGCLTRETRHSRCTFV